jgi:hypothetical protein
MEAPGRSREGNVKFVRLSLIQNQVLSKVSKIFPAPHISVVPATGLDNFLVSIFLGGARGNVKDSLSTAQQVSKHKVTQ